MSQQIIGIGSAPNDGTGDALRTAFDKANGNFDELYTAISGLGNAASLGYGDAVGDLVRWKAEGITGEPCIEWVGTARLVRLRALNSPGSDVDLEMPMSNGSLVSTGDVGTVTSTMLASGIPYSKLDLAGAVQSNDLAGSIAPSKISGTAAVLGGNTFTGLLQFSGSGHSGLRLNNLTTTQRDALSSPAAGMMLWNTTLSRLSVYNGSAWTDGFVRLAGDTMTGQLQIAQGSIAASAPLLVSQTWNSGTPSTGAFEAVRLAMTLTNASSTSSGFFHCLRDNVSRFFMDSGGTTYFGSNGASLATLIIDTNNLLVSLRNNAFLHWYSSGATSTYLYGHKAASTLQLGADTATSGATASAQLFKACDATHASSGTGASLTLAGGKGATAGGALILATFATNGASPVAAMTIDNSQVVSFANAPKFGTHSAIGAETVTGYITITDAGGTSRKLAVLS